MTERQARRKAALRPELVVARVAKDAHDRLVVQGLDPLAPGRGYRLVGEAEKLKEGQFLVLEPI